MIIFDWKTAICLLFETIIVYAVSTGMQKYKDKPQVFKSIFMLGIVFCVGQLGMYKYYDFFIQSISGIADLSYENKLISFVPLGISFFTFSSVGYLVDVYRQKDGIYENFKELALYLAFFLNLCQDLLFHQVIFIKK